MIKQNFDKAYYIKLGKGNEWAEDSIKNNKIRIGWRNQSIDDIVQDKWEKIKEELLNEIGSAGAAARDLNSLKNIVSNDNKIFITFYGSKLYWCRPKKESLSSDEISKYIMVDGEWSCQDIDGTNRFYINQISGKLSKYQGFRATCCEIGSQYDEINYLKRLINNEKSSEYNEMILHKTKLCEIIEKEVQQLHPKDFELLIDLIFRQAGWRRQSVVGESMEYFDLVLEEVISNTLYGIQIKTKSSKKEFLEYVDEYNDKYKSEYDKFIYVVHSPEPSLDRYTNTIENVELWNSNKVSGLIIELGLTNWILEKIR